jgi:hypothetical protein
MVEHECLSSVATGRHKFKKYLYVTIKLLMSLFFPQSPIAKCHLQECYSSKCDERCWKHSSLDEFQMSLAKVAK